MIEPKVVYEDKNFLVLNKPAGLLVHRTRFNVGSERLDDRGLDVRSGKLGAKTSNIQHITSNGPKDTLVDWLLRRYPEVRKVGDDTETRPGIVHRLDKGTSGIMIVAKNQAYFEYLKKLFQEHKVKKTYLALVFGKFKEKEGVINKPIGIKSGTIKRSTHSEKMAKEAVTEYEFLRGFRCEVLGFRGKRKFFQDLSLLKVYPKTGRTHQIRVHLASIGHPVLGDDLYGKSNKKLKVLRLMLHAQAVEFSSEDGEKLRFETDVPSDFLDILKSLEESKGATPH